MSRMMNGDPFGDRDDGGPISLMNVMRVGFITLVAVWTTQLYFKKRGREEKLKQKNESNSDEQEEEGDDDLFSDQDYQIKDNYGITDGAFKMVAII